MVPALYLRLGKDQECYDFVKWYATAGQADDYDWGDMSLPYLDVKNADVFESVDYMCTKYPDLTHLVATTLLKIKLLLSLTALKDQSIALSGFRAPVEIVDDIKIPLPDSAIVTNNSDIMSRSDHTAQIEQLTSQVKRLYETVGKANQHFWPALLRPEGHLTARPEAYSSGSVAEMQLKLQYSYDSWKESPAALQVIRDHTLG